MSVGLSRQEYWSESLFPPPGDLPNPGIEPGSPALVGGFFTLHVNEITQYVTYARDFFH